MEAVLKNKSLLEQQAPTEVLNKFFKENSLESTRAIFFVIFQCWSVKTCKIKAEISDEEVALFFDQLIDLVAAAHTLHEANRAQTTGQKGKNT